MDPPPPAAPARDAFPAAVQPVSRWALANALAFMLHSGGSVEPNASAPARWMPRCAAAQAAAAVLALLLPPAATGRRTRLLLASAALAATFANHVMYGWLVDLAAAADPVGHLHLRSTVDAAVKFFVVADNIAFLTLVEGDLGAAVRTFLSRTVYVLLTVEIIGYYIL